MGSIDLAMAMESLRREADTLLVKKQPFSIEVLYDGVHLITSLKEIRPDQPVQWLARATPKEKTA